MTPLPTTGSIGLLGKAPCQGDFIRVNAGDPAVLAFHRWLEEAHESLGRSGGRLGPDATYFLYAPASSKTALVGVFGQSTDKVGRTFPLSVFVSIDAAESAHVLPALPGLYREFLRAAAALIANARTSTTAQELAGRLKLLPLPQAHDVARADTERRNVLSRASTKDLRDLFGEGQPGAHYYAVRTFITACSAERGREPEKPGITLDCPLSAAFGPAPWLDLAQRLLQWQTTPPNLLWTDGDRARLLLALGPLGASALVYLCKPDPAASKLWPLKTDKTQAITAAAAQMLPLHRTAIDAPSAPLDELFHSLSR